MYSVDDLRTFIAIVETQGVTSGARRVGISPATASHRLGKLEAALKLTLLHRNSRTVRLTDAGQIFFERTQAIITDLEQAERDAGGGTSELTGHLRVTMSPWILSRFLLPALRGFQREHPQLVFDFLAVDRFVPLTAEGQDCAIRVGQMADSAMVARKLCDNHRIICASPDFLAHHGAPETISDLLDLPWVCLPWQRRLALRDAKGRKRDVTVGSRVLVSNSDMLTDGSVQGLGLAVKSRLAIKAELDAGQLVEVFPGKLWEPDAPIWFVVPPEARSGHKARVFGDMVRKVFRDMDGGD
ncbi:LysR family transcriptional regulator [uncultured Tateyamaria sp.]|uniref:LysR family transcriptional regulator n=1 Tax=uncultured Tateyamaria sp. TaxID=455651 RepID=UPI00261036EF|nr:LysR family transcriptional regulator [uncultured Tateyamaria sp.]